MKTTLEIPDELFRRAKAQAAARGISLRQFVTEAVEQRVYGVQHRSGQPAWRRLSGALVKLRGETARIDRFIEDEFERIDPDDG